MFLIVVDSIWIYYFSIKLISNLLAVAKYNDISKYYGIANNFLFFSNTFYTEFKRTSCKLLCKFFISYVEIKSKRFRKKDEELKTKDKFRDEYCIYLVFMNKFLFEILIVCQNCKS